MVNRETVTQKIVFEKVRQGLRWSEIAPHFNLSKEYITTALLGQMKLSAEQAGIAKGLFNLSDEEAAWLQITPYKGSLPTAVPTDPLIYRFYELVNVYGLTFKELISEEFGDGIMSAIDFSMDLTREPHANGDRVSIVMSGKFLPYKSY
ncbi:MAG: cyanase [Hymenobacter sp.]|nr:MAG: cyanase [Hymenobacter sp.]